MSDVAHVVSETSTEKSFASEVLSVDSFAMSDAAQVVSETSTEMSFASEGMRRAAEVVPALQVILVRCSESAPRKGTPQLLDSKLFLSGQRCSLLAFVDCAFV